MKLDQGKTLRLAGHSALYENVLVNAYSLLIKRYQWLQI